MENSTLRTLEVQEMEKIEGGISLAAFGCGLGIVGLCFGQAELVVATAAMCSVAMSE